MKLIVGLGNFGTKYENTFHNVGFRAVNRLANKFGFANFYKDCKAICVSGFYNGEKVVLAQPQTFMNLSGESILAFVSKYKLELNDLLVIYDDLDLPLGEIRYRQKGSAGTHNGMRNIVDKLDSKEFSRLRIGIGRPKNEQMDIADFVLSKMDTDSQIEIEKAIDEAIIKVEDFLSETI